MKRIILAFVIPSFLFFSCYFDASQDTSRVVMAVALPPSPNVARLHVAVFAGLVLPETLILKQTFEAGSLVALIVPSGPYRVFMIWAENPAGEASHYGVSIPMNLSGENTASVPIEMYPILFTPQYSPDTRIVRWDTVTGATEYEFQVRGAGYVYVTKYLGTLNSFTSSADLGKTTVRVRGISSMFGISTGWSTVTFP